MREKHIGLGLFSLLVFIFLLGPLLIISVTSFEPGTVLKFPPEGFSLRWYENIFNRWFPPHVPDVHHHFPAGEFAGAVARGSGCVRT